MVLSSVGFCSTMELVKLECVVASPPNSVYCQLNEVVLSIEQCSFVGPIHFMFLCFFSGYCIITSGFMHIIGSLGVENNIVALWFLVDKDIGKQRENRGSLGNKHKPREDRDLGPRGLF